MKNGLKWKPSRSVANYLMSVPLSTRFCTQAWWSMPQRLPSIRVSLVSNDNVEEYFTFNKICIIFKLRKGILLVYITTTLSQSYQEWYLCKKDKYVLADKNKGVYLHRHTTSKCQKYTKYLIITQVLNHIVTYKNYLLCKNKNIKSM